MLTLIHGLRIRMESEKLKSITIIGLLLLLVVIEGKAQKTDPSQYRMNGVYTEFYVIRPDFSDGFVSINYERVLGKKLRSNFRIGLWPDFESAISIPITFTWITSPQKNHHFEYGVGTVFRIEHFVDSSDPTQVKEWFYDMPAIMLPLMYRYQKNSGLYFRAGINVFISWPTLPSPSFSLGYKF